MTKKLINIKNFLRIIISLFVIINMAKSCAKAAAITQTMRNDLNEKANKVFQYYDYTYRDVFTGSIGYSSGLPTMCIGITASNSPINPNYLYVFYPVSNPMTVSGNYYETWFYAYINLSNGNISYPSGNSINKTILWKYVYTEFDWSSSTGYNYKANNEYGAEIIFAPEVNINFGHLFSTTITYNSEEIQANELNYNYRIEYIDNVVTEDNEITSMQATLGTLNLECQDLGSYWTLKCNNSTLLQYNQVYDLIVSAIVNGNEEEIEEKVIFVPPGTTISGGVITSIPSGDYNFNTENATNQIIENQQQQQDQLLNMSGDSALVVLPSYTFSGDQSANFFTFVLDSIEEVFLSEDDASLTLPIYGEEIEINSTDLDVLPSSLKLFIGGYHWFWVGMMILKDIRKIFENLKNGDFEKIASDDINANLI